MEKISRKKIEQNVNKFLDNSFISKEIKKCYSVDNHPFFLSFAKLDLNLANSKSQNNLNKEEIDFIHQNNFCTELKIIYDILGGKKEMQIYDYTFFSLENIMSKSNNYNNFIDVALKYQGMGHVKVLAMCKNTSKFFIRDDGGSNSYERQNNFLKYKDYLPDRTELINFSQLLNVIID